MHNLWAPWRIKYLEDLREEKSGCIFCEIVQQKNDREQLVLYRGKDAFVVMNRYPYGSGHLLVVPHKHVGFLSGLEAATYAEMMTLASESIEIIKKTIHAEGFNCGINIGRAAGAGIAHHIHLHVVPRWIGDVNFLPVLADIKSMPEYLEKTYERLVGEFDKIKRSTEYGVRSTA